MVMCIFAGWRSAIQFLFMSEPVKVKRNLLRTFSPCMIAAIFSLIGIFLSGLMDLIWTVILGPFLLIVLIADLVLKLLIKKKTWLLWLIESAIILFIMGYLFLHFWT